MKTTVNHLSVKRLLLTEKRFADAPKGVIRDYKVANPVEYEKVMAGDDSPTKTSNSAYHVLICPFLKVIQK